MSWNLLQFNLRVSFSFSTLKKILENSHSHSQLSKNSLRTLILILNSQKNPWEISFSISTLSKLTLAEVCLTVELTGPLFVLSLSLMLSSCLESAIHNPFQMSIPLEQFSTTPVFTLEPPSASTSNSLQSSADTNDKSKRVRKSESFRFRDRIPSFFR